MCSPEQAFVDGGDAYATHSLGRELAPAIYVPAMAIGAVGQFRTNYAIANGPAAQNTLQGSFLALYDHQQPIGRATQRLFFFAAPSDRPLSSQELMALRATGVRIQAGAGVAMQATQLIRLGVDVYALAHDNPHAPPLPPQERAAVLLDTATITLKFADAGIYNVGLAFEGWGSSAAAIPWLKASHMLGVAGGAIQIVSGGTRLTCEAARYFDRWEINDVNAAIVLHSALDIAHGMSGAAYSLHVLNEAGRTAELTGKTNILMNVVKLSPRQLTALRTVGAAGAAFGLIVNAGMYYDASLNPELSTEERDEQQTIAILGATGSGFMLVGSLLATPAVAPLAGVLVAIGIAFIVYQSLYQHRQRAQRLFDERPPPLQTID